MESGSFPINLISISLEVCFNKMIYLSIYLYINTGQCSHRAACTVWLSLDVTRLTNHAAIEPYYLHGLPLGRGQAKKHSNHKYLQTSLISVYIISNLILFNHV